MNSELYCTTEQIANNSADGSLILVENLSNLSVNMFVIKKSPMSFVHFCESHFSDYENFTLSNDLKRIFHPAYVHMPFYQ